MWFYFSEIIDRSRKNDSVQEVSLRLKYFYNIFVNDYFSVNYYLSFRIKQEWLIVLITSL